jgi:hypothetical protein
VGNRVLRRIQVLLANELEPNLLNKAIACFHNFADRRPHCRRYVIGTGSACDPLELHNTGEPQQGAVPSFAFVMTAGSG